MLNISFRRMKAGKERVVTPALLLGLSLAGLLLMFAFPSVSSAAPQIVPMIGPVEQNKDLRSLPYIAPKEEFEERVLTRYPHGTGQTGASAGPGLFGLADAQQLVWPAPTMPPPLLTFEGVAAAQSCACAAGQRWRCRPESLCRSGQRRVQGF